MGAYTWSGASRSGLGRVLSPRGGVGSSRLAPAPNHVPFRRPILSWEASLSSLSLARAPGTPRWTLRGHPSHHRACRYPHMAPSGSWQFKFRGISYDATVQLMGPKTPYFTCLGCGKPGNFACRLACRRCNETKPQDAMEAAVRAHLQAKAIAKNQQQGFEGNGGNGQGGGMGEGRGKGKGKGKGGDAK